MISQGRVQQENSIIEVVINAKNSAVFIPVKEVLSMSNMTRVAEEYRRTLNLDATLTDIITKAQNLIPDTVSQLALNIAKRIEHHIEGKVYFDEKEKTFWIAKNNGDKIPFTSEAEGFRKLGLLWQLVMNQNIKEGTILLWDEPEANINPKLIPFLVDILLTLEKAGVQMFLATHDYLFAKYLEVRKKNENEVRYHAFAKSEGMVICESQSGFELLENNSIIDQSIELYKEEVKKVME
jgi:predicted ATP-dependent endonuclease of OLD family